MYKAARSALELMGQITGPLNPTGQVGIYLAQDGETTNQKKGCFLLERNHSYLVMGVNSVGPVSIYSSQLVGLENGCGSSGCSLQART